MAALDFSAEQGWHEYLMRWLVQTPHGLYRCATMPIYAEVGGAVRWVCRKFRDCQAQHEWRNYDEKPR